MLVLVCNEADRHWVHILVLACNKAGRHWVHILVLVYNKVDHTGSTELFFIPVCAP